ncbi:hypothetical protein [Myxococcus xanthus]|uniref:hypothetical protein n=1 Tax=Myxococcus xanthus TaxID=34 RepID=UPI0013756E4A|nr:hypothetical protein [Myxococcus xanthus]
MYDLGAAFPRGGCAHGMGLEAHVLLIPSPVSKRLLQQGRVVGDPIAAVACRRDGSETGARPEESYL